MVSLYDPNVDELTNIFHLISAAIGKCGSIFKSVVTGRYFALYLAVFLIIVIMRFLIVPLIGVSGSDGVVGKAEKEKQYAERQALRDKYKEQ